jgi:hypothetical protein
MFIFYSAIDARKISAFGGYAFGAKPLQVIEHWLA